MSDTNDEATDSASVEQPDVALLCSMATRLDHAFGTYAADRQRVMLSDMRKLYDEVMGRGYYRPENRGRYTQWLSSEIEGGERTSKGMMDGLFAIQRGFAALAEVQSGDRKPTDKT